MFFVNKTLANFSPLSYPYTKKKGGYYTLLIKHTYAINDDGSVTSYPHEEQRPIEGDVPYDDELGQSVRRPNDIPDVKPLTDVIVNGHACAPGGEPVERLTVAFEFQNLRKELLVTGEREWCQDKRGYWYVSAPQPFTTMPMRWEKSYGALDDMRNPLGKGGGPDPLGDPEEPRYPLPNIEDPAAPVRNLDDRPEPVSFGAIPIYWQPRDRKYGTRDLFWANFRAPHPPKDHDQRYYNAAPDDQQVEAVRGDEWFVLEHMDAAQPARRIALPGVRKRMFYVPAEDAARELRELALHLDTIVCDLDDGTLTLLWRGQLEHEFDAPDEGIAYFYVEEERVDQPPWPKERYQEKFEKEIETYEELIKGTQVSSEGLHNELFPAVVAQIASSLQDVEADPKMIEDIQNCANADEILSYCGEKSKELGQQVEDLVNEINQKYGQ